MWDGINRMPRPLMALGTIGLFVWCAVDPSNFVISMKALQNVPEYLWLILGAVITFYFGGRALDKAKAPETKQTTKLIAAPKSEDKKDWRDKFFEN